VRVDGTLASGVAVRNAASTEGSDPPNVLFTVTETWESASGFANPAIHYTMFVDRIDFSGSATTAFVFNSTDGPTSCNYSWTFRGSD
jgi:hypothetical protein